MAEQRPKSSSQNKQLNVPEWGKSVSNIKNTATKTKLVTNVIHFTTKGRKSNKNPTLNEVRNINNIHLGKIHTKAYQP